MIANIIVLPTNKNIKLNEKHNNFNANEKRKNFKCSFSPEMYTH